MGWCFVECQPNCQPQLEIFCNFVGSFLIWHLPALPSFLHQHPLPRSDLPCLHPTLLHPAGLMFVLLYGRKGVFAPLIAKFGFPIVFAFPGE